MEDEGKLKSGLEKIFITELGYKNITIDNSFSTSNNSYMAYSNNSFAFKTLKRDYNQAKKNENCYFIFLRGQKKIKNAAKKPILEKWALISKKNLEERIEQEKTLDKNDWINFDELRNRILEIEPAKDASLNNHLDISQIMSLEHNFILYGPPGTGKTRKAKIWAAQIATEQSITERDENKNTDEALLKRAEDIINKEQTEKKYWGQIKLVQFHPEYSYNDFIETLQITNKMDYTDGILKKVSAEAKINSEKKYVLIIDEINRANVGEVLGEALFGLEYRNYNITTSISGKAFSIPDNVYIIGTMNTADYALSQLDYAIRRRFCFVKMEAREPERIGDSKIDSKENSETDSEKGYITESQKYFCKQVFYKVKKDIKASVANGIEAEDIMPGISYFLVNEDNGKPDKEHFEYKMKYELIPLLKEYAKNSMFTKRKKLEGLNLSLIEILQTKEEYYLQLKKIMDKNN